MRYRGSSGAALRLAFTPGSSPASARTTLQYYVRIIGLVPIYSLESWMALRFKDDRVYFETARDAYEAFVLYAFFQVS